MHSMYEGTLLQAELLSLSCGRDKLCVVEVVVVHFVQLYFANAYQTNKHTIVLCLSQYLDDIESIEQLLNL